MKEYLKFGMTYCGEEFLGVSKKHKCIDADGFLFDVSLASLRVGKYPEQFAKGNKYTIENIKLWTKINGKNFKLISNEYHGSSIDLNWKCDICNKNFNKNWNGIQQGSGCSKCNKLNEYSPEKIKDILYEKNKNVSIDIVEYINLKQKIIVNCLNSNCNHKWEKSLESIVYHSILCPKCSGGGNIGGYNFTMAERNKEEWLNVQTKIYIIEMFNDDFTEQFYKIGITNRSLSDRFRKNLPYKFDKVIEYKTNLYNAIYLENSLHVKHRDYEYIPKVKFDGYTECFSRLNFELIATIESQL